MPKLPKSVAQKMEQSVEFLTVNISSFMTTMKTGGAVAVV